VSTDRLKEFLQAAVELEMSTIPPYLCALYSIWPMTNDEATLVVRSVVVEEMLHMVLAANMLNAIGGEPHVTGNHVPRYPHELPSGVTLHLLPFSPEVIDAFMKVENPEHPHSPIEADHPLMAGRKHQHHQARSAHTAGGFNPTSIGEFYHEIIRELEAAAVEIGEQALFCGDTSRQVGREYYYAAGGRSILIHDMASARGALNEIVEQGEGDMGSMYDDDGDLAHFYRLKQIKHGHSYLRTDDRGDPTGPPVEVDYASVFPMVANPRGADYTDPALQAASAAANRAWSQLLLQIEAAFNGKPEALLPAVHSMFKLRNHALVLLANPMPGYPGRNAGPTFEWDPTAQAELGMPL
jgi:ferritin-like protein